MFVADPDLQNEDRKTKPSSFALRMNDLQDMNRRNECTSQNLIGVDFP